MLVNPRQDILDVWKSVADSSFRDGRWHWGGRRGRNSISDAEQLLCLLYPATQVPVLRLDNIDSYEDEVLKPLRKLGSSGTAVIRTLLDVMLDYYEKYTSDVGPVFAVGSYLGRDEDLDTPAAPTDQQRELELVDSYSMSVTLSLAVIGFLDVLRTGVTGSGTLGDIARLRRFASDRLTAAMTGLIRSFTIHVFEIDSEEGRNQLAMVNQGGEPGWIVAKRLSESLQDIRTRLREEVTIGSLNARDALQDDSRLFECGWSWGVVKDAGDVDFVAGKTPQHQGLAVDRPYLYFTTVALDGIEDLFDRRTRILGLLDDDQQRLATSLQLRWELSLDFWTRLATFGSVRWPLEDVPWRTTDGGDNDYFSLFVASMVVQSAGRGRSAEEIPSRAGRVLEDLANRGRITRRPLPGEAALDLHVPGVRLPLTGLEELGPAQGWAVTSYSSLLLKRTVATANLIGDTEERDRLTSLGDRLWEHLRDRRLGVGDAPGLWDQPSGALPVAKHPSTEPSWYHTQRVVECLVQAAKVIEQPPPPNAALRALVGAQLSEAERLFDQALMRGTRTVGHRMEMSFELMSQRLRRARELRDTFPGSAQALVHEVLLVLDELRRSQQSSGAPESS